MGTEWSLIFHVVGLLWLSFLFKIYYKENFTFLSKTADWFVDVVRSRVLEESLFRGLVLRHFYLIIRLQKVLVERTRSAVFHVSACRMPSSSLLRDLSEWGWGRQTVSEDGGDCRASSTSECGMTAHSPGTNALLSFWNARLAWGWRFLSGCTRSAIFRKAVAGSLAVLILTRRSWTLSSFYSLARRILYTMSTSSYLQVPSYSALDIYSRVLRLASALIACSIPRRITSSYTKW